jgi:chromosomal replication initiation ATPase DnaA
MAESNFASKEIREFFFHMDCLVRQHPIDAVNEKLKMITGANLNDPNYMLVNFIVRTTADAFKVSESDLRYSIRRGDVMLSRNMCFVLIKKHMKLTDEDTGLAIGENNRYPVVRALKYFRNANKSKTKKKFIVLYEEINQKVVEYCKSLSTNNTTTKA